MIFTPQQEANIKLIIGSLKKISLINTCLQVGILACVSKESNFIPQNENLMYSFPRIKQLFPNLSDEQAHAITGNPEAFGNHQYGGKYGNGPDEGYKYRGRGFNQVTFKGEYEQFGKLTGHDLVNNPDLLLQPGVAADVLAAFFKTTFDQGIKIDAFKKFGIIVPGDIKDPNHGVQVAIQINGGIRTDFNNPILQEGYNKALEAINDLIKYTV